MGAGGRAHTAEYYIESVEKACVMSAKSQMVMLQLLLENNAEKARFILDAKQPKFKSKEDLFSVIDRMAVDRDLIDTNENDKKKKKI